MSGFDNLLPEGLKRNFEPSDYEKAIHRILTTKDAGKYVMDKWKKDLVERTNIKVGDTFSKIDIGILIGRDNHIKELLAIVERINNGGK